MLEEDGIETGAPGSSAAIVYADGTRAVLSAGTTLSRVWDPRRGKILVLARGTIAVQAVRQPPDRPLVVSTPHAEARVLGTTLRVTVEPGERGSTRLEVTEGKVRLSRVSDRRSVEVSAGHFAVAAAGVELAARPLPKPPAPVLLVVGSVPLSPGDAAVKARLEALGHAVTIKPDDAVAEADAPARGVVILSSTINSVKVDVTFRSVPVPVMTWEAWAYDGLGMTGSERLADYGETEAADQTHVAILAPAHPLAGGLSRIVRASAAGKFMWGRPSASAARVATLASDPAKVVIFGYEKGVPLPAGFPAPARRVGFFLPDNTPPILNDAGWTLFDAAVRWCSDGAAR